LTAQQVYTIRQVSNEQAFQGIEKAMFYRICRLLTLNIQLIFVFDGPGRPWKRGKRGQGKINYEERRLLTEMLENFGIPWHEAPGEAEAECARLQLLGMVDAVWSQDSDCLMFGCSLWIHDDRVAKEKGNTDRSKKNTKKNGKFARRVQASDMKEKYGLDREGLVLFAMLVGGDYDKGLLNCGRETALRAVKQGLGQSLCACRSQRDCSLWSGELTMFLQSTPLGRRITIPPTYPDYKTLQKYYHPKVSSDEELLNNPRLRLDHAHPIREQKLLELTSSRFNIWGKLYYNWVGPVLLMRDLVNRSASLPKEKVHQIELTKQRANKAEGERIFERQLTFSPFSVTVLSRKDFEGDRLGYWDGNMEVLFNPEHRVKCEIPEYWLRKVLPSDVLDPPPPAPKRTPKRKRQANDTEEDNGTSPTVKRTRIIKENAQSSIEVTSSARSRDAARIAPQSSAATRQFPDLIELSDSEDDDFCLSSNTRSAVLPSIPSTTSHIVDLGSPESSEHETDLHTSNDLGPSGTSQMPQHAEAAYPDIPDEEDEDLQLALQLSMQDVTQGSLPLKKSRYDDIFAMREAGREVHGDLVPSWSLDEATSHIGTSAAPAESTSSRRFNGSSRVTLQNVISVEPRNMPDWSSSLVPAAVPARSASSFVPLNTGDTISQEPTASRSSSAAIDIRAARLKHFASSPVALNKSPSKPLASLNPTPSTYRIPDGVDFIDLTDD
jgi:Holliday junction resolvase YEN1